MSYAATQRSRPVAGRTGWARLLILSLLVVLTVGGLTACTASPDELVVEAAPAASPPASLVTISDGSVVERSAATGRAIRTLARNATSAAETSSRTMLYASGTGCSSTITEATRPNHLTPVAQLKNTARDLSVSRDGAWIGYLTYDHCPTNHCPGSSCAGAAEYGPNVLVIEDTATTHSTRLRTPQGSGIDAVSFSPNGLQLAMWLNNAVLIISTSHPSLSAAIRLAPPHGCVFGQPAWTARGIYAGETCGSDPSPAFPIRLALLDPDHPSPARTPRSIPLPPCIDSLRLVADPLGDSLLVTATTSYGSGACAGDETTRIDELHNGQLRELLHTTPPSTGIEAVA